MRAMVSIASIAGPLAVSACAYFVSWDDSSKSWIGHPISKFVRLNGEAAAVTQLSAGESEHRFDLPALGPSCVHWWRVNGRGTIVGYRYKGSCRVIG
jgi:hypothetical protein